MMCAPCVLRILVHTGVHTVQYVHALLWMIARLPRRIPSSEGNVTNPHHVPKRDYASHHAETSGLPGAQSAPTDPLNMER